MGTPGALREVVSPRSRITLQGEDRHVGGDLFAEPTAELRRVEDLCRFPWGGKAASQRRRKAYERIDDAFCFGDAPRGGCYTHACEELGM